jgi:hypothetical protein
MNLVSSILLITSQAAIADIAILATEGDKLISVILEKVGNDIQLRKCSKELMTTLPVQDPLVAACKSNAAAIIPNSSISYKEYLKQFLKYPTPSDSRLQIHYPEATVELQDAMTSLVESFFILTGDKLDNPGFDSNEILLPDGELNEDYLSSRSKWANGVLIKFSEFATEYYKKEGKPLDSHVTYRIVQNVYRITGKISPLRALAKVLNDQDQVWAYTLQPLVTDLPNAILQFDGATYYEFSVSAFAPQLNIGLVGLGRYDFPSITWKDDVTTSDQKTVSREYLTFYRPKHEGSHTLLQAKAFCAAQKMNLITEEAAKHLTYKPYDIYRFWLDKEHDDKDRSWVGVFENLDKAGDVDNSVQVEIKGNYPFPLENKAHVICFKDL